MPAGPCAALLDRVGGDHRIFVELCDAFLEDAPRRLRQMRRAVAAGDARALKREAHAFKGAAAAFDAADVVAAARDLERIGASGDLREAGSVWQALELLGDALVDAVRAGKDETSWKS